MHGDNKLHEFPPRFSSISLNHLSASLFDLPSNQGLVLLKNLQIWMIRGTLS
jgi:hypothetical protein